MIAGKWWVRYVIIKWFYFCFFWFHQPYAPALHKNHTKTYVVRMRRFFFYRAQSLRNAAETYNIFLCGFFAWVKYGKFIKDFEFNISENPRKALWQSLDRGINNMKNEYLFELCITQAFFCSLSGNFTTSRSGDSCFLGHPIRYIQCQSDFFSETSCL